MRNNPVDEREVGSLPPSLNYSCPCPWRGGLCLLGYNPRNNVSSKRCALILVVGCVARLSSHMNRMRGISPCNKTKKASHFKSLSTRQISFDFISADNSHHHRRDFRQLLSWSRLPHHQILESLTRRLGSFSNPLS